MSARTLAIARLEHLASLGIAPAGAQIVLDALRSGAVGPVLEDAEVMAQQDARRLSEWMRDLPRFCTAAAAHCWADADHSRSEAMSAVRFHAEQAGKSRIEQERAVVELLLAELVVVSQDGTEAAR